MHGGSAPTPSTDRALDSELQNDPEGGPSYRLPFNRASAADRRLKGAGLCIQGNHGASTHQGTLEYAFDFRLPVGTPIVASRDGVVAAIVSHFVKGGLDVRYRPRANFVAIQHADGTYARYFHLRHNGVTVKKGDRIAAGDPIGLSGNTGYSSTPHLHYDVVDVLPEDTCHLEVVNRADIPAVAAAFSCRLPRNPLVDCRIIRAIPPDARTPLTNSKELRGNAVLIDRGGCSFTTKVKHALMAEVACLIVANSNTGPELFSMGGTEVPLSIPAVLISKESGDYLSECLCDSEQTISLRSTDGYDLATRNRDLGGTSNILHYVAKTQPIRFKSKQNELFIAEEGTLYPRDSDEAPAVLPQPKKIPPKACCAVQ
mmetsp:Transcript_62111/g.140498  ORF Transcript_62111/g.140498 Transcript_62111/m.140498 type:complete len:372 (+) Transcript_62111:90-1205(+)